MDPSYLVAVLLKNSVHNIFKCLMFTHSVVSTREFSKVILFFDTALFFGMVPFIWFVTFFTPSLVLICNISMNGIMTILKLPSRNLKFFRMKLLFLKKLFFGCWERFVFPSFFCGFWALFSSLSLFTFREIVEV